MGKLAVGILLTVLLSVSRVAAAPVLPTGFYDEVVAAGLDLPTAMAWLPDGRILVVEQKTTRVRLVVKGMLVAAPLLTVPDVELLQNEEGLVGLALDPAYPARPYVYLYFMHAGTSTNWLVMYTLTGDLADPDSTAL